MAVGRRSGAQGTSAKVGGLPGAASQLGGGVPRGDQARGRRHGWAAEMGRLRFTVKLGDTHVVSRSRYKCSGALERWQDCRH